MIQFFPVAFVAGESGTIRVWECQDCFALVRQIGKHLVYHQADEPDGIDAAVVISPPTTDGVKRGPGRPRKEPTT